MSAPHATPDLALGPDRLRELRRLAIEGRRLVLRTAHGAGAGHIGGPLSAMDMLVALYFEVLNVDPSRPRWEDRDRFILSKGHSALGLYAVLALRGYLPIEELATFDQLDSRLQAHPDMTVLPGLDMSTGSLGQGLSPGVGMALGARFLGRRFHVWVMVGDGDAQEGEIWEAAMVAARYGLDNLIAVVDLNGLQQFGWAGPGGYASDERMAALYQPAEKWGAFGWRVVEVDGHDIGAFLATASDARRGCGRPTVIIAHTTKGKGVSFMEGVYSWHTQPVTDEVLELALAELDAQEAALR
jgi:transketolase